jgi:molybdopterin converting factor small subunit
MTVTVHYQTQIKRAVGRAAEALEVPPGCSLVQLLRQLVDRHGEPLRGLVLKEDGGVQDSILVFIGDVQVSPAAALALRDGENVTLLAPMAGG